MKGIEQKVQEEIIQFILIRNISNDFVIPDSIRDLTKSDPEMPKRY